MVVMGLLGHINVKVCIGAEAGVVVIQTSGDIWIGMLVSGALHNCNEHLDMMSTALFANRVVMQDGGFANGWKGLVMLQNWPFAFWQAQNWAGGRSTAIVASLVPPKYFICMSYHAE